MQVIEEIGRKKIKFRTDDWKITYHQFRNIINKRFDFSVEENKFEFDEERNKISYDLELEKKFDNYTKFVIETSLNINTEDNEVEIEFTGLLKTEYPEETPFQRSTFYFFLRTIWDKIYYGRVREKYTDESKRIMNTLSKTLLELGD